MGLMKFGHWDNIQIVLNETNFYNFCRFYLFYLVSLFIQYTATSLFPSKSYVTLKILIIHNYSLVNTPKLLTYTNYH